MHRMIIFDDGLGQLGPMTDLRACFELRTGMLTTGKRIAQHRPKSLAGYWVPQRLQAAVAERADAPVNQLQNEEVFYCVNGRWAIPEAHITLDVGEALIEQATEHVIAAMLRRADAEYFLTTGHLHERVEIEMIDQRVLYKYPWDVLRSMKQVIPQDILSVRIADAIVPNNVATVVGEHPVEIHPSARIYPNVAFDAELGPIIVHEGAVIRPGCVICGPCSIGPDSTVLDRAMIKPNTVIGPHCKVAGEIGSTIFQGFSNKAHDGHLGDSWIGKWVNFGAGTTNSNLLNTYGEVTMRLEPDGQRLRTGMQFLGAIVGEHVKTAICTRIMTGTVIGTGAMIATTQPPPTCVPRFAWLTDDAPVGGSRRYQIDRFIEVAKTMMARRHVKASEVYLNSLRELHQASLESSDSK
jgi:UDP-N-acetylglucosamine diphosphorylase / glucose-1-phosphate thymidylyltransferase / UDP-N-acetylgalactosamine diphosphorylase / glucosamine-1-phosphate N-acetyltransferase / galactosamine-1-phosphate N-acetyltransferase